VITAVTNSYPLCDAMSNQLISVKRVKLGPHHLRPGLTQHRLHDAKGVRDFPPFVALEIAHYPSDSGYYLFHVPESGPGADTWHESLEDAMHQAEFEFKADEWVDVCEPFG
jgi:hypothetical protein